MLFSDCINSIYVVFNSVKSWEFHLNILCQKRKIRAFIKSQLEAIPRVMTMCGKHHVKHAFTILHKRSYQFVLIKISKINF